MLRVQDFPFVCDLTVVVKWISNWCSLQLNIILQDSRGKVTLLGMMEQCLKAGKKQSWHSANVTNVCVGLLSGLKVFVSFT